MTKTGQYTKPQGSYTDLDDLLDEDSYYPLQVAEARLWESGNNAAVLIRYEAGDEVCGEFFSQNSMYFGNMIEACERHLGFDPAIDEDAEREEIAHSIYEQFCEWLTGNTVIVGKSRFGSERANPRWGVMAELTKQAIDNGDVPPLNGGQDAPAPFSGEAQATGGQAASGEGKEAAEESDPVKLLNRLTNSQQKNLKARVQQGAAGDKLIDMLKRDVGLTQLEATKLVVFGKKQWRDNDE